MLFLRLALLNRKVRKDLRKGRKEESCGRCDSIAFFAVRIPNGMISKMELLHNASRSATPVCRQRQGEIFATTKDQFFNNSDSCLRRNDALN